MALLFALAKVLKRWTIYKGIMLTMSIFKNSIPRAEALRKRLSGIHFKIVFSLFKGAIRLLLSFADKLFAKLVALKNRLFGRDFNLKSLFLKLLLPMLARIVLKEAVKFTLSLLLHPLLHKVLSMLHDFWSYLSGLLS